MEKIVKVMKWTGSLILTIILAFTFSFFLSTLSVADPVDYSLRSSDPFFEYDAISYQKKYEGRAAMLGMNKPNFYFSWLPKHLKELELYNLTIPQQDFFVYWAQRISYSDVFQTFYEGLLQLKNIKPGLAEQSLLWNIRSHDELIKIVEVWSEEERFNQFLKGLEVKELNSLPCFVWNGSENQFHQQMIKIFGIKKLYSTYHLLPVSEIIPRYLIFTLFISGISLIILIGFSFLFVELLSKMRPFWQSVFLGFFDWIYAMPVFWIATLAVMGGTYLYTNNLIGFLGSPGIFIVRPQDSVFKEILNNIGNLFWPILVIVLNGLAYFINYIKSILTDEKRKIYVQSFLLKGYTDSQIYTKFLRRRVIYSITALIPGILASLIAGSVVLEVIFNIPGMGSLLYSSIKNYDWNMVHLIVILTASLIWIGNGLSNYLQRKLIPIR